MTLSSILAMLEQGAISELRTTITRPLVAFRRGLAERGRSAPVELDTIDVSSVVSAKHVAVLLNAHADGALSQIELRYLANALDLSPDASYETDGVRDVISHLADSDAIDVQQLLEELRSGPAA